MGMPEKREDSLNPLVEIEVEDVPPVITWAQALLKKRVGATSGLRLVIASPDRRRPKTTAEQLVLTPSEWGQNALLIYSPPTNRHGRAGHQVGFFLPSQPTFDQQRKLRTIIYDCPNASKERAVEIAGTAWSNAKSLLTARGLTGHLERCHQKGWQSCSQPITLAGPQFDR
jgi:hypothetical protein